MKLPNELNDSLTIVIQENKLLNDCYVTFLCEALAQYPESVIIQNNGANCTKEEILKYCKTVNTNEIDKIKLVISPNPTCGTLRIDNVEHSVSILISNMSGQVLKTIAGIYNEINIDDLPAGVYIVDIRNKAISERFKIVKME